MGLNVAGKYGFNGPYTDASQMLDQSGVYLISVMNQDGTHRVIDVGESEAIRSRIANHDRRHQWAVASGGLTVYGSTYHCSEAIRMTIERELRLLFNPICGVR
jgi:hypothetical protein